MTREMKVGMAVIGVLLTAFSGVLYKRLHKSDDLPEAAAERPAAAGAKPQKTPPAKPGRNVAKLPSELEAESAASGSSSKKAKATSSRRSASSTASDSSSDPFARASASTSASKPSPRYAADSETSDSETSESESSEDSSEVEESDFPAPRRRYAISDTVNDDADAESSSDDDIPMADDRYSETLDEVEEEEPPSYRGRYRMAADDSREDEESEDTSSSEEFDPVEGSYDDSEDEVAVADDPSAKMEFPERPVRDADAARTSFQDRMNRGTRLDEPLPQSLDSADSEESADEDGEPYSPGPDDRPIAAVSPTAAPRRTEFPSNPPRATIRRNQQSPIETAEDAGGADPELEPESIAAPRSGGRSGNTYVVTAGESLFDIARQELGAASQWTELYDLNHDRLTGDLESLPAGLKLDLPTRQARTPRTNSAGRLRLR